MRSLFPDETNEHKLRPPFVEGGSASPEHDVKVIVEGRKMTIDGSAHTK